MKSHPFYIIVLGILFILTGIIYYDAQTCNGWFCGMSILLIPFLWGIALILCLSYFFTFRKTQQRSKSTTISIAITVGLCLLGFLTLKIWGYYSSKPYLDNKEAEQARCKIQLVQYGDRYNISDFSETAERNIEGKIEALIPAFVLNSKNYTGQAKITLETGAGSGDFSKGWGKKQEIIIEAIIPKIIKIELPITAHHDFFGVGSRFLCFYKIVY